MPEPLIRFQSCGTLYPNSVYVERTTDRVLRTALHEGDYCYVFAPSQIGKSSLCSETLRSLESEGIRAVVCHLLDPGQEDQWWFGLVDEIILALDLDEAQVVAFWEKKRHLSLPRRFTLFLLEMVLKPDPRPLALFIDEMEKLPPWGKEFLDIFHSMHCKRATAEPYRRLSVCFIGLQSIRELGAQFGTELFKVTRAVQLEDFTEDEVRRGFCTPLAAVARIGEGQAALLLTSVMYWASGHPQMLQAICEQLALDPQVPIDEVVNRVYLAQGRSNHALFTNIERRIMAHAQRGELLKLYRLLLRGPVPLADSPLHVELRFCGLATTSGRNLRIRNRIMAKVFDDEWVAAELEKMGVVACSPGEATHAIFRPSMSTPKSKRPLYILHVTDLHFTASHGHFWTDAGENLELQSGSLSHDRRGLAGGIRRDLLELRIEPDLVVISGDLLDRANPDGVIMALRFLEDMVNFLKLPRSRIVLVPGNHDVQRGVADAEKYRLFGEIWNAFYKTERSVFDPAKPAHQQVQQHLLEGLGIELIGFNSCEALDSGQEHGSIGAGQRDYADTLLRSTESRGLLRIGVMHHHLEKPPGVESRVRSDYSEIYDAPLVRQWMVMRNFRIVLHGHQHLAWEQAVKPDGCNALLAIVAGGSAGVAKYGRDQWRLPLYYQVVRIDSETAGQVIRRRYKERDLEWEVDSENDLHFGLMKKQEDSEHPNRAQEMQGLRQNLEGELLRFLVDEYGSTRQAKDLWVRAGGNGGRVPMHDDTADMLWRSLLRMAAQGAISLAGLLRVALQDFPGNQTLTRCLAALGE